MQRIQASSLKDFFGNMLTEGVWGEVFRRDLLGRASILKRKEITLHFFEKKSSVFGVYHTDSCPVCLPIY